MKNGFGTSPVDALAATLIHTWASETYRNIPPPEVGVLLADPRLANDPALGRVVRVVRERAVGILTGVGVDLRQLNAQVRDDPTRPADEVCNSLDAGNELAPRAGEPTGLYLGRLQAECFATSERAELGTATAGEVVAHLGLPARQAHLLSRAQSSIWQKGDSRDHDVVDTLRVEAAWKILVHSTILEAAKGSAGFRYVRGLLEQTDEPVRRIAALAATALLSRREVPVAPDQPYAEGYPVPYVPAVSTSEAALVADDPAVSTSDSRMYAWPGDFETIAAIHTGMRTMGRQWSLQALVEEATNHLADAKSEFAEQGGNADLDPHSAAYLEAFNSLSSPDAPRIVAELTTDPFAIQPDGDLVLHRSAAPAERAMTHGRFNAITNDYSPTFVRM